MPVREFFAARPRLAAVIALIAMLAAARVIYPDTMKIVEIENDIITVETATGIAYQFEGAEDYNVGDLVSVLMYSSATPHVYDDEILDVRYAGAFD